MPPHWNCQCGCRKLNVPKKKTFVVIFSHSAPTFSVLLNFELFTKKPVFRRAFAHPIMLFLSYLVKNSMDDLCDLQISYEMVPNVHVCQLTVSL